MKTTLLTTILSVAALSAALFASPASAQCTCQRHVQTPPPAVYVQPPVVDYSYDDSGYDDSYYSYDNTQVIVELPYGYWDGGYWRGRYFARGWYEGNRGYNRGYRGGEHYEGRGAVRGGGERFYQHQRGGDNYGHGNGGHGGGRR